MSGWGDICAQRQGRLEEGRVERGDLWRCLFARRGTLGSYRASIRGVPISFKFSSSGKHEGCEKRHVIGTSTPRVTTAWRPFGTFTTSTTDEANEEGSCASTLLRSTTVQQNLLPAKTTLSDTPLTILELLWVLFFAESTLACTRSSTPSMHLINRLPSLTTKFIEQAARCLPSIGYVCKDDPNMHRRIYPE